MPDVCHANFPFNRRVRTALSLGAGSKCGVLCGGRSSCRRSARLSATLSVANLSLPCSRSLAAQACSSSFATASAWNAQPQSHRYHRLAFTVLSHRGALLPPASSRSRRSAVRMPSHEIALRQTELPGRTLQLGHLFALPSHAQCFNSLCFHLSPPK